VRKLLISKSVIILARDRAFRDAFMILERRISLLLCLPLPSLDKLAIQKEIDRIGKSSETQSA
jgi:arsenate reductase